MRKYREMMRTNNKTKLRIIESKIKRTRLQNC